ncbi:MAG TPA: amidohydrolase family protein [bacterium]|nr:amidohydrolase family protein [bacterium]
MPQRPAPFAGIPLYDHHAHSLRREQPATPEAFRAHFTESDAPETVARHVGWSLFYRRSLADLGGFFGCEPREDAVLAARARRSFDDLTREMFADAGIGAILIDPGFRAADHYELPALRGLLPCPAGELLRLEVLAERLIPAADGWPDLRERFAAEVRAAVPNLNGLKTIIAYRTGLDVRDWDAASLAGAFRAAHQAAALGHTRLASKPLLDSLLWTALEIAAEHRLPVQVHTGFGDRDLDLRLANPLWLRPVFEHPPFRAITFVLLHTYPYVREAAWLTHVYPHVAMDLSLTVPFAAHAASDAIVEALGLAPASKVLLATDAFSIPDLFWLAGRRAREALDVALAAIEARGFAGPDDREVIARRLLWDNAVAIYGDPRVEESGAQQAR